MDTPTSDTETSSGEDTVPPPTPIGALKNWTGKTNATIVYDSTVDEFSPNGLFAKIQDRPNIALVGFTTDGDVFGGYYSRAVTVQSVYFNDPNIFFFSFKSHGRCATPQRFVARDEARDAVYVEFCSKDRDRWFGWFGVERGHGLCGLGNERSDTWCEGLSVDFETIEDAPLTGCTEDLSPYRFHRLLAVQLA